MMRTRPYFLLSLSICYQENSKNTKTEALASTASVMRSVLVTYRRIACIAHNTQVYLRIDVQVLELALRFSCIEHSNSLKTKAFTDLRTAFQFEVSFGIHSELYESSE